MYKKFSILIILFLYLNSYGQEIPAIYTNLGYKNGKLFLQYNGMKIFEYTPEKYYSLKKFINIPQGNKDGIKFNFQDEELSGTLHYGFINYEDGKYPLPVYFHSVETIVKGKAFINIKEKLSGKYDMISWEKKGYGTLGYRIILDNGTMLYDGVISFKYDKSKGFSIIPTIIEGPFINKLTDTSCVISFRTNMPIKATILVNNNSYTDKKEELNHEIEISKLKPYTKYEYTIKYGILSQSYSFKTALPQGSRKPFTFAYISDSRGGRGGGERNFFGPNAYILKKIVAMAVNENAEFIQFTGDLISGYSTKKEEMKLQYANFKRAVEPFWHYIPLNITMGNHEAYNYRFYIPNSRSSISIDKFPFENNSAESIFSEEFVNFENGPISEDGAYYDPNPDKLDFPKYKETVFWYSYGNTAIIVLNSNYWYSPSLKYFTTASGNLHAYIMDKQFEWLKNTLEKLEKNKNIDHIFITLHTPFFPNGGHGKDDMWYNGDNSKRPVIAGTPVKFGIIERRDQLLDLLINKSSKVVAILTGDEHNYNRLYINNKMKMYPDNWKGKKLNLKRAIYQINNGAAGAPYYAQEKLPWSKFDYNFSTQNAVVLIHVNGEHIYVEVKNPVTFDIIDKFKLK